jgi:hypothetical protein
MSRSLGFIGLIIVVAIGAFIYMKQVQSASPAGVEGAGANPQSTVDIAGIKNDLLSIAQAERAHMASQGKYVSVDELVSSGELNIVKTRRPGWTFSSEASESSFKVTATYPTNPPTRLSVDESMSVKSE